ncbi:LuxR C-terminal-related transcriptional regulator [Rhodococcus sp. NPDC003348]
MMMHDHLFGRLDRDVRLVVLRAPLGFGKSALVGNWLQSRESVTESVVWMDRPTRDIDPDAYWASVRARAACPECGTADAGSRRRRGGPVPDRPASPRILLILDRVDLLGSDEVEAGILRALGGCRHLKVVATVCDGGCLADLAALGCSHDLITADDLRLSPAAARSLAEEASVHLEPGELEQLHEKARGMPALLRVAVAAARGIPRGAGRGARLDYAVERALRRRVRDLFLERPDIVDVAPEVLLRLATARELTPAVASFLVDEGNPQDHLERLEAAGVLGRHTQSEHECWEFAPAVRYVLLGIAQDNGVATAHNIGRLARFHVDRGEPFTALRLALDARDWDLAVDLVEAHWADMIAEQMSLLRAALELLPAEMLVDKPAIRAGRELFVFAGGQVPVNTTVLPYDDQALQQLTAPDATDLLTAGCVQSLMLRVSGEFRAAAEFSRRLAHLSRSVAETLPDEVTAQLPIMRLQWGITYQLAGDLAESNVELTAAYRAAVADGVAFIARNAAGSSALNWALVGEPRRALEWLADEHTHAEPVGWLEPKVRVAGMVARALISLDQLDIAAAGRTLGELGEVDPTEELWALVAYARCRHALLSGDAHRGLVDLHRTLPLHHATFRDGIAVPLLTAAEIELRLALGQGNRALAIVDTADTDDPWIAVSAARARLLTGDPAGALALCRRLDEPGRHHPRAHLGCRLVEAAAHLDLDEPGAAVVAWQHAGKLAELTGLRAPLATIPRRAIDRLVTLGGAHVGAQLQGTDVPAVFPGPVEVVRLTEREQAVLTELAHGSSVREAAANLFVSVNTVKTQQRTLYRKLGAHSKDEALGAATRLGLLAEAYPVGGD